MIGWNSLVEAFFVRRVKILNLTIDSRSTFFKHDFISRSVLWSEAYFDKPLGSKNIPCVKKHLKIEKIPHGQQHYSLKTLGYQKCGSKPHGRFVCLQVRKIFNQIPGRYLKSVHDKCALFFVLSITFQRLLQS